MYRGWWPDVQEKLRARALQQGVPVTDATAAKSKEEVVALLYEYRCVPQSPIQYVDCRRQQRARVESTVLPCYCAVTKQRQLGQRASRPRRRRRFARESTIQILSTRPLARLGFGKPLWMRSRTQRKGPMPRPSIESGMKSSLSPRKMNCERTTSYSKSLLL